MRKASKIVAVVVSIALLGEPMGASAQVHQSMQDFFNSFDAVVTGTPGGAYDTQTRGYVTGGAVSVRMPMQSTQLFSVSTPSFQMGCNGFDAYFGAFSHVSLDRFVQLVQQLGTGAVLGFAFQLAMNYLSPSISSVLAQLEAIVRSINEAANLSPCQTGKQLGADLANVLSGNTEVQPMLLQRWNVMMGNIRDPLQNMGSLATRTSRDIATALSGQTHGDDIWDVRGNITWDVLNHYYDWMPTEAKFLLMSMIGTIVVGPEGAAIHVAHTIEPKDLLDTTRGHNVTILTCADTTAGCLQVVPQHVNNMEGFKAMLVARLRDLVNALNNGTIVNPSLQNWVNQLVQPVYAILTAHRTPDARDSYIQNNAGIMAATLVRHFLSQFTWGLSHGISVYKKRLPNWPGEGYVPELRKRLDAISVALARIELEAAQTEAAHLSVTKLNLDLSAASARRR